MMEVCAEIVYEFPSTAINKGKQTRWLKTTEMYFFLPLKPIEEHPALPLGASSVASNFRHPLAYRYIIPLFPSKVIF